MYTFSLWAARHLGPARIIIVGSYVLLTVLGVFLGDALFLFQINIPVLFFYNAVVLFLAVYLIYPDKQQKHRFRHFYRYQKTCDLVLVSATFFFITCMGNQPQLFGRMWVQPVAAAAVSDINAATSVTPRPGTNRLKPTGARASTKSLRKLLVEKVHVFRKAFRKTSKGGKVLLIVLSVLIAFLLIMLIGSLSCSLSCSGSDGAAILVALGGIALVTFLLIKVIRRITKGPKPKEIPEPLST